MGAALERNEEYAECFPQCGLNLLLTHKTACFSCCYFCETDFSFKKTSKWHSPRFTSGICDLEKNRFACYFPRFAAVPLSWRVTRVLALLLLPCPNAESQRFSMWQKEVGRGWTPEGLHQNKVDTPGLKHRKEVPRAKMKGAINQTLYPY